MLVQYRFSVYFLPGFTAMHWLQIIATFQIFLNFRKSQIHAKKFFCLIIFKEKWSLKKVTRKSKFKVYGYGMYQYYKSYNKIHVKPELSGCLF